MKCNNGTDKDTTPFEMKRQCLLELSVFKREVEILRPRAIVFYTGWSYDAFLGESLFAEEWQDIPGAGRDFMVPCGKKRLPWWEGAVKRDGQTVCRVLRTAHPERKKRSDFVGLISGWLKDDRGASL